MDDSPNVRFTTFILKRCRAIDGGAYFTVRPLSNTTRVPRVPPSHLTKTGHQCVRCNKYWSSNPKDIIKVLAVIVTTSDLTASVGHRPLPAEEALLQNLRNIQGPCEAFHANILNVLCDASREGQGFITRSRVEHVAPRGGSRCREGVRRVPPLLMTSLERSVICM